MCNKRTSYTYIIYMTGARININTYINIKHRVRITTSTNTSSGNPNNNNGHTNSCSNIKEIKRKYISPEG